MTPKSAARAPEMFTYLGYEAMLRMALDRGYRFEGFNVVASGAGTLPDCPIVILRHDIDFDPACVAPIAEIEERLGVQSTYFFQLDSRYYSANGPSTMRAVRRVLELGHWIGLHFDANGLDHDDAIIESVEQTAARLEQTFGCRVSAVSFHMPTYRKINHLALRSRRVNTYSPVFFDAIEYVSDSNQDWRGKDIVELLERGDVRHLQLLTHPIWWRESYSPFYRKMQELAEKLDLPLRDVLTPEQVALVELEQRANLFGSANPTV